MKRLIKACLRALPLALGAGFLMLLTAHPALASGFTNSGSGFGSFGNYLGDVGYFLTSPMAKFVGALAVVGGVITYIRGGELNQSMHIFGGLAIGVGALVIGLAMISSFGNGLAI